MCRFCLATQPPAGLLGLERELANWRPSGPDDAPPSWTVYRFVAGKRLWDTDRPSARRRGRFDRRGHPGASRGRGHRSTRRDSPA